MLVSYNLFFYFKRKVEISANSEDAINELTKSVFGYSIFGYWKFFDTDGAAKLLEDNVSIPMPS